MESYFGKAVTVYHSRLSDNRRAAVYHELLRCDGGRIVIGVRSSVLLPLRNLSLVIVDEEHDTSKADRLGPRYHGRDTAVVLASVCGASAARQRDALRRIVPQCGNRQIRTRRALGTLRRSHAAAGDRVGHAARRQTRRKYSHFNKILLDQIDRTLQRGRQAMLFQNRRDFRRMSSAGIAAGRASAPTATFR